MRYVYALITLAFLALLSACNIEHQPDTPPVVGQQHQALGENFCELHPVACEAFERLCDRHPDLCDELCDEHPNLPFCDDAPMCVAPGDSCLDEDDPNFVPCCEGYDCFFDDEVSDYTCQPNTPQCDPEAPVLNSECDPNGIPCCPYTGNPNDPPVTCQATDPSDPETSYVCTPG